MHLALQALPVREERGGDEKMAEERVKRFQANDATRIFTLITIISVLLTVSP